MMASDGTREYVAFDLETTGLLALTDRIVEFGAVRFNGDGEELGRVARLVNPGRPMPRAAQAVHGISDFDLADAPPAREVLPELIEFFGSPETTVLLAHNAWFDAAFLGRELGRAGMPTPALPVVDTLTFARRKLPRLRSHRLPVLAAALGLDPGGAHRATEDSLRVKNLWLALDGPNEPAEALVAYPIFDPKGAPPAPLGWEAVEQAIVRGRTISMEYEGGSRGLHPREVTPRGFVQRGGTAYLVAFCHIDALEKSFRLDRVRRYEVLP